MVVSLEEAITILSKWKADSATILVAAESPFRVHLRGIHDPGVDWTMGIRGRVARAEFSPGTKGAKAGIVVFEGSGGNLSPSIGGCAFVYEEPREAQLDNLEEARLQPYLHFPSFSHQTKPFSPTSCGSSQSLQCSGRRALKNPEGEHSG